MRDFKQMLTKFPSKYTLLRCEKNSSIDMSIRLHSYFYNSSVSQAELPYTWRMYRWRAYPQ